MILCVRVSEKCVFSEMWQDLHGVGGAGVNSGAHQLDQFGTTELTSEHQKILIDIRRKKTELLLEIQRSVV
ncbi:hypothetical protein WN48_10907 [Eufriesea mexicana]|uniref:Uncharacterized protein n=1 Tax=Eufriesea mexicana TaxID=516756 RepID=A0A310SN17_9HYME|nr:hypothetical protein WN48_10907 [Eufriesea mexicana]